VNTVALAGFFTNACIGLTAIDAYERDFMPILAGDAILGIDRGARVGQTAGTGA